jgi:WD40 repeat protein
LIAVGSGSWTEAGQIWLFDVATRKLLRVIRPKAGWINSVAFSPDSTMLACCGSARPETEVAGGQFSLWDVASSRRLVEWRDAIQTCTCVAFSSDGTLCAVAGGREDFIPGIKCFGGIQLWDVASRTLVRELTGPSRLVESCAFVPDSSSLVGGCLTPTLETWNPATTRPSRMLVDIRDWWSNGESPDRVGDMSISPDGLLLAVPVGSWNSGRTVLHPDRVYGELRLVNAATGVTDTVPIRRWDCPIVAACFSRDGSRLAAVSGDGMLFVWDVDAVKPNGAAAPTR